MRRMCIAALVMVLIPMSATADEFRALLDESDALLKAGLQRVADPTTSGLYLKAYHLAAKAADMQPGSYEANWKAARLARCYCGQIRWFLIKDWKKECVRVAKPAMKYGQRAIGLEPKRVEGHFWYACLIGSYSDGVSIITALKEGLKNKTQQSLEAAVRIDPAYWDYSPYLGLGEFWYLLPWPLKDASKARDLLEKYNKHVPATADNIEEGWVYLGMVLLESKDAKDKARGRQYLQKAAAGRFPYFANIAKEALR